MDDWLRRAGPGLSSAALLQLFEEALTALWARTVTTLGEVTLTAIADRVLHDAAQKLPLFASIKFDREGGIRFGELRASGSGMRAVDLQEGIRFVLVEFLTVLGHLTAEILTAELHGELSQIGQKTTRGDKGARSHPANRGPHKGRG